MTRTLTVRSAYWKTRGGKAMEFAGPESKQAPGHWPCPDCKGKGVFVHEPAPGEPCAACGAVVVRVVEEA